MRRLLRYADGLDVSLEQNEEKVSILKSGLKRKTLLLTGILMLAVIVVQLVFSYSFLDLAFNQEIEHVKYGFDANIKTAVDTLISALEMNYEMYLNGDIDEATAMAVAEKMVRDSRYSSGAGHEDDGYFWADMEDGYCVVHYNPANQGQMRWDWTDQEGTHYIREFIRLGNEGGGYSDFYFGKPGDESGSHKKRGYTRKFEPYGWYVSTGNYYEDTDAVIKSIEQVKRNESLTLFATSVITVAIGLSLVSLNLNRVVTPIINISRSVRRLSLGDTMIDSSTVKAHDHDEIGDLSKSTQKVAAVLHKLLDEIDVMINEHEKGNIDYSFETREFYGDYKRLADSVLELAAFSMKDQLTGIPNRRSFDNRIDLEWQRAIRERTPVSILIMDIDHFKIYNDTFGHQQGDVTLQVIANTIRDSLKRKVDFSARWGGEEFVILLPGTDAAGALSVAENIRKAIENAEIPCEDVRGQRATISIGVNTQIPEQESLIGDFVSGADAALYRAKEEGRNRISVAEGSL